MSSSTIKFTPESWSLVDRLYHEALELDRSEWAAFLSAECDDAALRDYVLQLLDVDPDQLASIDTVVVGTMSEAFSGSEPAAMCGERVGPYRIERVLGSGGMGVVYLAERADDQFQQEVAIKIGRHRLLDPQIVMRLRNERQILSDLDHPNIARLFDGGTTSDGIPYLVMEYIDGVRIDTYCDLHRLSIDQRLELFRSICGAVHFAHQNLVIHRDLKAANILVTEDGVVKLLDFGIAKLIDAGDSERMDITRDGSVMMTPANAAPEQILSQQITTATDVYMLGLLLYNLLSGQRAYDHEGRTPSEFARLVCEDDVVAPSSRLRQSIDAASTNAEAELVDAIAANRGTTIERLQRRLRGDLDTIVMKSLRKEPDRRYDSVASLADDIDLYMRSMPITARSESWRYRTGKFIRRHTAAVAASAAVFVMLAVFSIVLTVQNRTVAKERDTAREISQFLEDVFMAQDPAQTRGANVTADEILANGASRIQRDLDDRPEIQAALMGTIGRVYYNLGVFDTSAEMLEQALQVQQQADNAHESDVAALQNDLAEALMRIPDYRRAEELLNDALAVNTRVHGPISPSVGKNLYNLSELHLKRSELDAAEAYAEACVEAYEQFQADHSIEFAEAKNMLARILQVRGELDRTESLLRDAISILVENEGSDHPYMAYYLQNLGVLQHSKGDLDAAEATFEDAVTATRRIFGDGHRLYAGILRDQAQLLHVRGELEHSKSALLESLQLYREIFGPDHPMVGYTQTVLGRVLHDQTALDQAEQVLLDALRVYELAYEEDHQYTASTLTELGAVLNSADRPAEAEPLLARALQIRNRDYAAGHELVAGTQAEYADTMTRLSRFDEARPLLEESVVALQDKPGRRRDRALAAQTRFRIATGEGLSR